MGPVGVLKTDAGKIFAGIYALYCGLIELVAVGISAVPIVQVPPLLPFRKRAQTTLNPLLLWLRNWLFRRYVSGLVIGALEGNDDGDDTATGNCD